jgi:FkbM family methyltransferase
MLQLKSLIGRRPSKGTRLSFQYDLARDGKTEGHGEYWHLENISNAIAAYCFELLSGSVTRVHFVQIGAHDGFTHDPLYPFILKHKWAGVRVEPVPSLFSQLQENSKDMPYVQLMQVACARETAPRPFYTIRPGPDGYHSFLSSFEKGVVMAHRHLVPDLEARLEEITVETLTVDQIIARAQMPGVELLMVDAEGSDDDVVLSLNFKHHRPKLICFEHKHLRESSLRSLDYFLRSLGYTQLRLYTNTIYVFDTFLGAGRLNEFASSLKAVFSIFSI